MTHPPRIYLVRMIHWLAFLICLSPLRAQETISFDLKEFGGGTAEHQHRFSAYLTSDRGEELTFPGGEVEVEILGSWKSVETRAVSDSGQVSSRTVIKDADSWAKQSGCKLTFEQYPFTFGQLNDLAFNWSLDRNKGAYELLPDFRVYQIRKRTDIVNDLQLLLCSAILPALPDGPVSEGATWDGESEFERSFFQLGARRKKFTLKIRSQYKLVKIVKKGEKRIAEIEEKREFDYSGWMETVPFSVLVEGPGTGTAEWEIDATLGLVRRCEYTMNLNHPVLQPYGAPGPISGTDSNLKIVYDSKLKKLRR